MLCGNQKFIYCPPAFISFNTSEANTTAHFICTTQIPEHSGVIFKPNSNEWYFTENKWKHPTLFIVIIFIKTTPITKPTTQVLMGWHVPAFIYLSNIPTVIKCCNPISSRLKLIKLFVLSACVTHCTNLLDNQQRLDNSLSYREPGCDRQIPLSDRATISKDISACSWLLHTHPRSTGPTLHTLRAAQKQQRFSLFLLQLSISGIVFWVSVSKADSTFSGWQD